MDQAGLLLRLATGRALLGMGALEEAEALLVPLAAGEISEGLATFGGLAGLPPVSVSQQATRWVLCVGCRAWASVFTFHEV